MNFVTRLPLEGDRCLSRTLNREHEFGRRNKVDNEYRPMNSGRHVAGAV